MAVLILLKLTRHPPTNGGDACIVCVVVCKGKVIKRHKKSETHKQISMLSECFSNAACFYLVEYYVIEIISKMRIHSISKLAVDGSGSVAERETQPEP